MLTYIITKITWCRLQLQASVLQSVADAVAEISVVLRNTDVSAAGSTNSFGDDQLQVRLPVWGVCRTSQFPSSPQGALTTAAVCSGSAGFRDDDLLPLTLDPLLMRHGSTYMICNCLLLADTVCCALLPALRQT